MQWLQCLSAVFLGSELVVQWFQMALALYSLHSMVSSEDDWVRHHNRPSLASVTKQASSNATLWILVAERPWRRGRGALVPVHVDAPLDCRLQPPPGTVRGLDPEDQAPRPSRARVRARPQVPLIFLPFNQLYLSASIVYTCMIPLNALYASCCVVIVHVHVKELASSLSLSIFLSSWVCCATSRHRYRSHY